MVAPPCFVVDRRAMTCVQQVLPVTRRPGRAGVGRDWLRRIWQDRVECGGGGACSQSAFTNPNVQAASAQLRLGRSVVAVVHYPTAWYTHHQLYLSPMNAWTLIK